MDKNTLSNYGWIVICILVLSVMLALATPFGNFIARGFEATYTGFSYTVDNAFDTVLNNTGDNDNTTSGGDTGDTGEGGFVCAHDDEIWSTFISPYVHNLECSICYEILTADDPCIDENVDYKCDICYAHLVQFDFRVDNQGIVSFDRYAPVIADCVSVGNQFYVEFYLDDELFDSFTYAGIVTDRISGHDFATITDGVLYVDFSSKLTAGQEYTYKIVLRDLNDVEMRSAELTMPYEPADNTETVCQHTLNSYIQDLQDGTHASLCIECNSVIEGTITEHIDPCYTSIENENYHSIVCSECGGYITEKEECKATEVEGYCGYCGDIITE